MWRDTNFSTQISILRASTQLTDNKGGNIFVMDGHPDRTQVEIIWNSDRSVTVKFPDGYKIFSQKSKYRDSRAEFEVQYQILQAL